MDVGLDFAHGTVLQNYCQGLKNRIARLPGTVRIQCRGTKNAFQLISFTLPLVFQRQIYYLFLFSRAFGSSARGCLTWYGSLLRRRRFLLVLRLCFLLLWLFTHRRGLVDLHERVNVRIVVVCKSTVLLSADDIRLVCSFKDEVVFKTVPGVAARSRLQVL